MIDILTLNPGGNSLKVEVVRCPSEQRYAFEARKLISLSIEGIGHQSMLSLLDNKKTIRTEPIAADDYQQATERVLSWYASQIHDGLPALEEIHAVALRVVHGGKEFTQPARIDSGIEKQIIDFEKLAPLHNKNSVEILAPVREKLAGLPIYGVFDTAFHHTIPDYTSTYAIPPELTEKHRI